VLSRMIAGLALDCIEPAHSPREVKNGRMLEFMDTSIKGRETYSETRESLTSVCTVRDSAKPPPDAKQVSPCGAKNPTGVTYTTGGASRMVMGGSEEGSEALTTPL